MNIGPREQPLLESWGLTETSITPAARAVLLAAISLAEVSSQTERFEAVETSHLLLALAQNNQGMVAAVLADCGITAVAIEQAIIELKKKNFTYSRDGGVGNFSATIQAANTEAQVLGNDRIGPEHLLIAVARSNSLMGNAEQILRTLDVSVAEIIRKTIHLTRENKWGIGSAAVTMGDAFLNFGGKIFILSPEFVNALFGSASDSGRVNPRVFVEKLVKTGTNTTREGNHHAGTRSQEDARLEPGVGTEGPSKNTG